MEKKCLKYEIGISFAYEFCSHYGGLSDIISYYCICLFVCLFQESVPSIESCLTRYLLSWNGMDYRLLVLQLIAHVSLYPFQSM